MNTLDASSLWRAVTSQAEAFGLDPKKFEAPHRDVIREVAAFLQTDPDISAVIAPIIICGKPGTGKTTFLYVLDVVLREHYGLPDNIPSTLTKERRRFPVPKRAFRHHQTSLLSVRKWSELLNFMMWNQTTHTLIAEDLETFLVEKMVPMRVILADEVEMEGYAPTLPDFGSHGMLVIGTSNQYEFAHLNTDLVPPHIYLFEGHDMRVGDPEDAVITDKQYAWDYFAQLQAAPQTTIEQLTYSADQKDNCVFIYADFKTAIRAPILETRWAQLLTDIIRLTRYNPQLTAENSILLLDEFDPALLTSDYDSLIRFVSLFDAIEQMGLGVLVRNTSKPLTLNTATIAEMKTTIETAIGIAKLTKQRTLVGIDRFTSRLGQAGHQARELLTKHV